MTVTRRYSHIVAMSHSVVEAAEQELPVEARPYTPGSAEDFERLYRTSYSRVLFTLVSILGDIAAAEDCTQEAFVRAFRNWNKWQPDAPAEAWLHRIALNVAFSYRRWHHLRQVGEIVRRLGRPNTEVEATSAELKGDLWQALGRLPRDQAAAVILRHHHGYSNREIALVLHVPESTVAWRLSAAKERLRRELRGLAEEPIPAKPVTSASPSVLSGKARTEA